VTAVFVTLVAVVAAVGFVAGRRGGKLDSIEEWGLAGRRFGTLITWFLIGGDAYTAYTLLAVPGLVYGAGANGFFAVVYVTLAYPLFYLVMPRLWEVAKRHGHVTLADFAQAHFSSAGLGKAVAFTGILATVPYIALQLVGIEVAIQALGYGNSSWPLWAAFGLLVVWDYASGLRAPASVAVIKDVMVFTVVIAAMAIIPQRLGGFAHILAAVPAKMLVLQPGQYFGFATLALGSALAILLYPHITTSVLSASSQRVVERNAVYLQAYNLVLGLIAALGFMALAAGVHAGSSNEAVPLLLTRMMPGWFAGFCLAAIAIGGLVPAAVMAIAAASLFTRNLLKGRGADAATAKRISLGLKLAALAFVLWGRPGFMINFQLLGGIWILQTLPAVLFGLMGWRVRAGVLIAGWAAGMATGTAMAWWQGMGSLFPVFGWNGYSGLWALAVNLAVVAGCGLPTAAGAASRTAGTAQAQPRLP